MTVTAKGKLHENDYVRAMRSQRKGFLYFLPIMFGLFCFTSLVMILAGVLGTDRSNIEAGAFALLPAGFFGILFYVTRRSIRRMAGQLGAHSQDVEIVFSREAMTSNWKDGESKTEWNKMQKIVETKDDFLIFPLSNMMWPVPKSFFDSESDIAALRELLGEGLVKKTKLQKQ
ncbi:MAG: YcxB family protein [Pyrinomonadaceae bacterium]|nr:YcxB family protein [Pyrinomonadaceae bacterium]